MYEVHWTSPAKDDLVCAITYIADMLKALSYTSSSPSEDIHS